MQLHNVTTSTNSDIIATTETSLKESVSNSELFSDDMLSTDVTGVVVIVEEVFY